MPNFTSAVSSLEVVVNLSRETCYQYKSNEYRLCKKYQLTFEVPYIIILCCLSKWSGLDLVLLKGEIC
jgi:hypothetical protein